MVVLLIRYIFVIWRIFLCGFVRVYKLLELIFFKNMFFRNLLRILEIYYIFLVVKEEKL